jgi:hypothetical protein
MTLYWPPPEHIEYLTDKRPARRPRRIRTRR